MFVDGPRLGTGITEGPTAYSLEGLAPEDDRYLFNGWLAPNGTYHPCAWREHQKAAVELGYTMDELLNRGWTKNSSGGWMDRSSLTQAQIDFIEDTQNRLRADGVPVPPFNPQSVEVLTEEDMNRRYIVHGSI